MDPKQIDILTWQAPEYRTYEKGVSWYVTLVLLTVLTVGFFVIQKDYFAAVCIFILSILIFFFSRQKPETITITFDAKGLKYGKVFFPYAQIKHFWIVDDENHRSVNIETTAVVNSTIVLELENMDSEVVREFLINFLPEQEEASPTVTQRISRKLKF